MEYGYAFVMPPPPQFDLDAIEILEVRNSMVTYKLEDLEYWLSLSPKKISEASENPCDRVARAMMPDIKKTIAKFHKKEGRLRKLI